MRRPLLVVLAVALAACSSGADAGSTTTTAREATTTTTEPRAEAYAVGRRTITVVDRSRPTAADPARDLPAEPDRAMEVLLLYPAAGPVVTPTAPADDAPPASGVFPLVVFAHGVTGTGPAYEGRIRELARAGFVVAAPTFPRSSGSGGQIGDYVHQPADMSFVIDEVLDLPSDDPLAGHVDRERVGVAGHSLGGITTIGLALNRCCLDERIDAAVAFSGRQLPFPDGEWDLDATPFLLVHGAEDAVVDVSGSDELFADAPGPAAYLRFPEGDHTGFLFTEGALVDEVVVAFLDRYLYREEDALDDVPATVEADGSATFEVKPEG